MRGAGVEFAHLKPFAHGGSNEADNIADSCRDCHVLLDAGVFGFSHFDEAGCPVFVFDHTRFESSETAAHESEADSKTDGPSQVRERAPPYRWCASQARGSCSERCDGNRTAVTGAAEH